jgi:hypothetical protein
MEAADSSLPAKVSRVALRFAQAEAQFFLAGVNSENTKFFYVISQLDHWYAAEVEDIITSPPKRDPYTTLRTELVRRLSPSREQRIRQLLTLEEMGDRKPSQFLRHFRGLAPDVPEDFLYTIWPSRLSPNIQTILAGQQECSLDPEARCAGRISEVSPQPVLASFGPPPNNTTLLQEIDDLSRHVAALSTKHHRHRISSRDPRSSTRYPDPTADPPAEATPHPPSSGTIAALGQERRSVRHPAPTTSRETDVSETTGGTCLINKNRPPLHYG